MSAGDQAWYILRVADALRRRSSTPASRRVLDDIELPLVLALADMELAGVAVNRTKLGGFSAELGEPQPTTSRRARTPRSGAR